MVDLKHLRASMLLSQVGGVAVANLAGWAVEWTQYGQGHVGGRPLGGNEDLYSNLAGSLFGRLASLGGVSGDWANATSGMLERLHGPLTMVRDAK